MAVTRDPATLRGSTAHAYQAALQAVAVGRWRRTFDQQTFVRTVIRYMAADAPGRAIARERARADRAEQRAHELAQQLARATCKPVLVHPTADDLPPRLVIELPRPQYEVFAEFCEGLSHQEIAENLGITPRVAANRVAAAAAQITPAGTRRAAAMVNRGAVALVPIDNRRAA